HLHVRGLRAVGGLPTPGRGGRGCSAGGGGGRGHQQQQRRAERHAIDRERSEAVRLDVAQQPFDRDEGGDRGRDESHRQRRPVLVRRLAAAKHIDQLVGGGREHRRNADQERKLRRRHPAGGDRKSTRLNSSHVKSSY